MTRKETTDHLSSEEHPLLKRVNDHTLNYWNSAMQMLIVPKHIFTWKSKSCKSNKKIICSTSSGQIPRLSPISIQCGKDIKSSTANQPKQYISMNHKAILNSVRRAGNSAIQHTRSILNWLKTPPATDSINSNMRQRETDNLVHNVYAKKKKNREPSALSNNSSQLKLTGFLSLRQVLNKHT